jgi:hypothetical protein
VSATRRLTQTHNKGGDGAIYLKKTNAGGNQIASLLNLDRGSSGTAKYVSITRRFYDIDRSIGW